MQKKTLKWLIGILLTICILIGIFLFISHVPFIKVYVLESGTKTPLSNKVIQTSSNVFCIEDDDDYSCNGVVRKLDGKTNSDGSILVTWPESNMLNSKHVIAILEEKIFEWGFEVKMDNYQRSFDDYKSSDSNTNIVYLTEVKNPYELIDIKLNQKVVIPYWSKNTFYLSEYIIEDNKYYQLTKIDETAGTIELIKRIGKRVYEPINLKLNEPSYIPGEISDSQIVLKKIDKSVATIQIIPKETINSWSERALNFNKYINDEWDAKYEDALKFFEEKGKEYNTTFIPYYLTIYDEPFYEHYAKLTALSKDDICLKAYFRFINKDSDAYQKRTFPPDIDRENKFCQNGFYKP